MLRKIQPAFIITRREVRDQFRDWRIILPILALTIFFPGLMNFTAEKVIGYVQKFDVPLIGDRLIPFLLMIVGFFPISVSLVIALESFVGEKERRSIEPLLSTPLMDWQLYVGKLLAVFIPPLLASYIGIGVYLFAIYHQVGWLPDITLLIQVLALAAVQSMVMVSGAVVISTQTTSTRAANLLASFIVVPMAMLLVGESMVMFWAQYDVLWWAIFGQILIAGLLIRTGIAHFNREELLGEELDTLNLAWAWRIFRDEFMGKAKTGWRWYINNLRDAIKTLSLPMVLMLFVLILSMWVGAKQADRFPLSMGTIDWKNPDQNLFEGINKFGMFNFYSISGVGYVWLHNLRSLVIATFLGIFSFGVLGIIVLMLPFMLIGYFMSFVSTMGISPFLFFTAFVLPHGLIEIPAIIIAGSAIIRLGASLAAPANGRTIGESWLSALADWAKTMIVLVLPLFLLAAIIEVYITPLVVLRLLGT